MLKKLFMILIGMGTVFSSDDKTLSATDEIHKAMLSIFNSHRKIEGRGIKNFCNLSDENNELCLCTLEERPKEPITHFRSPKTSVKRSPYSYQLFGNNLDSHGFYFSSHGLESLETYQDWDSIAVDPIHSQSKTIPFCMNQAVSILMRMFRVASQTKHEGIQGAGIGLPSVDYSPVVKFNSITGRQIDVISYSFNETMSYRPVSFTEYLVINNTLDSRDIERLAKSELFAAQIYTELLKKGPKEIDGVKIIYTSEQ